MERDPAAELAAMKSEQDFKNLIELLIREVQSQKCTFCSKEFKSVHTRNRLMR
jgi:hypothetical protein